MSLYPVSNFNIGTGVNSAGLYDSIGTAVLTDRDGNTVATLSSGIATFLNTIILKTDLNFKKLCFYKHKMKLINNLKLRASFAFLFSHPFHFLKVNSDSLSILAQIYPYQ